MLVRYKGTTGNQLPRQSDYAFRGDMPGGYKTYFWIFVQK